MSNIFVWGVPILLGLIFVYRLLIYKDPKVKEPDIVNPVNKNNPLKSADALERESFEQLKEVARKYQLEKRAKRAKLITSVIGTILLIAIACSGIMTWLSRCPTSVSPQEFADMIDKDENYKAGVLYEKKFVSGIDTGWRYGEDNHAIKVYRYSYGGHQNTDGSITNFTEIIYSSTDMEGWLIFDLMNLSKYERFFRYLKKNGAVELPKNGKYIIDREYEKYTHIRFQNCIFIQYGFNKDQEMYEIPIVRYKELK